LQVRPTDGKSKAGGPASSEATKEHVEAEVNKAKVATKRHQRFKTKQQAKAQEQEQTRNKGKKERPPPDAGSHIKHAVPIRDILLYTRFRQISHPQRT